jgi:lipopolysaccharide/colanic/teichoic acid biosynthesis glycosyltransferase/RimJ/RimL family protein N-acetyltransferase
MTTLRHRRQTKRALDTALIVAASPVVVVAALATALAVRVILGSPVLFRHERVGLNEKTFTLFKFRSMLPELDTRGNPRGSAERLTRFGRLLRRSSLDELPQLWNVLRGDMSLVGPRPLLPEYLVHYRDTERARHQVRPGLTGASQVAGRNNLGWDERLSIDAQYALKGTIRTDLNIVAKTVFGVLSRRGAVADPGAFGEPLNVHRGYPVSGGYTLRRMELRDVPLRVEWFNDRRVANTMSLNGKFDVENTNEWLLRARTDPLRKDLVVFHQSSQKISAFVGYRSKTFGELPILYIAVDPDQQGRGLGTIGLGLLLDYMREEAGVAGATSEISSSNKASVRVHEKHGMTATEASGSDGRFRMVIRW